MNRNERDFIVEKIRTQYTEKTTTELDALRALDAKVKRPANIFAYVFGSIGAIVMGAGMSLVMTDIGEALGLGTLSLLLGIPIGLLGILMVCLAYPVYTLLVNRERARIAPEILRLSDELMK